MIMGRIRRSKRTECRLWRPKFLKISGATPSVCKCRSEGVAGYGERTMLIGEVVGTEPFVAALAAFAEGRGDCAEEVAVAGAVVVHDALDFGPVAGGVELFVLFGAWSGGGAHSVEGHFGCHSFWGIVTSAGAEVGETYAVNLLRIGAVLALARSIIR